jgi:DNA-binding CsgD family transcriptional regulator/tetratricopeptide (TPR) repeat protein
MTPFAFEDTSDVRLPVEPPLLARQQALRALVDLVRRGEQVLVVAGPPGVGATRLAREVAREIAGDRGSVLRAETGGDTPSGRLERALADADLGGSGDDVPSRGPVVALVGDVRADQEVPRPSADPRRGTRLIVVATAVAAVDDLPSVVLRALGPADSRRLALAVAPGLDDDALAGVVELADGLPGRLVPLARAAVDRPAGRPVPIPQVLLALVRDRLAGLSPSALEVARWGAILDDPLELAALVRVTGHAGSWVERALDDLVLARLVEELGEAGPPRWRFRERLVPAAVAADLAPSDRRRRHAAALVAARATGGSPATLVRHAVGAADAPAVVTLSLRASADARSRGDAEGALAHADRALAWCETLPDASLRLHAHVERGTALADRGDWVEGAEVLERAAADLRALGDENAAIAAWSEAATAKWTAGDLEGALSLITETALAAPATPQTEGGRASALTRAAIISNMMGRYSKGASLAAAARESCLAMGLTDDATRALIFLAQARLGSGRREGFSDIAQARAEAGRGSGQRNKTLALICESHFLLPDGRPSEAADVARRGIAHARDLGIVDHEMVLRQNLAQALTALGDLDEAGRQLELAAGGWRELGQEELLYSDAYGAWLTLARGDIDLSLAQFHGLSGFSGPAHMPFDHVFTVMAGHALAASASGEAAEAEAVIAAGLAAWHQTDDVVHVLPLLAAGAEVGSAANASACTAALSALGRSGSSLAAALALLAEGHLLDRHTPGSGVEAYRRAGRWLDALGMRWWAARACLGVGVSESDPGAAADALLEARQRFGAMPAPGWRSRCEAALRGMGRRISSREPAAAPGDLTSRELEVLTHLAQGLKNREIGDRLYISERTVARHLISVFAKLGVTSRTAAARVARENGLLGDADRGAAGYGSAERERAGSGVVILSAAASSGELPTAAAPGTRRGGGKS